MTVEASEPFLVVIRVLVHAPVEMTPFSFEVHFSMTVDFSLSISVRVYFEFRDFIDNKI